ncbi:hypothetical protein VBX83_002524 [Enterococcus faecalis]|nr:hypothetical protein [Enterococcus faecalis]
MNKKLVDALRTLLHTHFNHLDEEHIYLQSLGLHDDFDSADEEMQFLLFQYKEMRKLRNEFYKNYGHD